ncbi:hypothetical protein GCM10022223_03940 [Kineosporia mesophila]|uniref:Alpha/beta-hydrolase catalytic domain-containing protein n=1 Tax=Kineosporia mesophila TaxID=566012 RepID=A0ABP6YX12_9ACTN|nr:alpha/beta-hydrolase family protein [Kineosporia mesophila]MCD5351874.1 alpha/beta-hydrolase family protein [Kineosporia mesophila]
MRTVTAAALLALVLPPRLLPHPLSVDILIGTVALLLGYATGALLERLPRIRSHAKSARVLAPGLLVVATLRTGSRWGELNESLGIAGSSTRHAVLAVFGSVLSAAAVLLAARSLRRLSGRQLAVVLCLPVLAGALVAARSSSGDREGSEFLSGARNSDAITAVTHRPATTPRRIYVTRGSAASVTDRVRKAVDQAVELNETTNPKAILIAVPTGSGWVNQRMTASLEELYDGDLTTVAVQYASSPSWLAFLRGGLGVRETTRELIGQMRARIDRLPTGQRPDLLVYGESLGAWGALPWLNQVDAALLVGVPGGHQAEGPGLMTLNHADDPVPGWRPQLSPVTFWRSSADVISSQSVPFGHGHHYGGPETAAAWCQVLRLPTCSGTSADQQPATGTPGHGG